LESGHGAKDAALQLDRSDAEWLNFQRIGGEQHGERLVRTDEVLEQTLGGSKSMATRVDARRGGVQWAKSASPSGFDGVGMHQRILGGRARVSGGRITPTRRGC
jgi:hypothetical protein